MKQKQKNQPSQAMSQPILDQPILDQPSQAMSQQQQAKEEKREIVYKGYRYFNPVKFWGKQTKI